MPHLTIGVINNNNIALPAIVVLSPHCVIAHFFTYVYRRRRSLLPPPTANITVYTNHRRLCLEHVKKADIEARDALRQGGCAPSITIQLCNTPVLSLPNRGVGLPGGNLPMHARSQRISLLLWRHSRTADRPSPSPTSLPRPTLTVFHLHRSLVGRHIQ